MLLCENSHSLVDNKLTSRAAVVLGKSGTTYYGCNEHYQNREIQVVFAVFW